MSTEQQKCLQRTLHKAARQGNLSALTQALADGADIDSKDSQVCTQCGSCSGALQARG